MHDIYLSDVLKYNANILCGDKHTILNNFSKDTRTICKNDIYIGIKGEKIDGSIYYKDAIKKGAKGCILNNIEIDKEFISKYKDIFIVTCDDTIKLIQKLAVLKRSLYDIPIIALTGSVGKTSTKDLVASVLSKKYKTLKTIGNYNNHIGVPLTILSLDDHEAAVIEMGMNNLGEISLLSHIAKPTVSIITNVGTAHIGILGSRENILKAKLEILDGMSKDGVLFINNDNDLLHKWYKENGSKYNIVTYGIENDSNYVAQNIVLDDMYSSFDVNIDGLITNFEINIPGSHFVTNALCAISIGCFYNVSINDIRDGIKNFELTKKRMDIENIKDITLINDSYNANYDSMNEAIKYLASLNGRDIAVLGDMLELGDYTESLHRKVGQSIFNNNIEICILVGTYSKYIYDELISLGFDKNNLYLFNNNEDAINKLKEIIKRDDNILFKASNSLNFNEIYEGVKNIIK